MHGCMDVWMHRCIEETKEQQLKGLKKSRSDFRDLKI